MIMILTQTQSIRRRTSAFSGPSALVRVVLAVVLTLWPAHAQSVDSTAPIAVIMDAGSGDILFSKNGVEPMVPASMTKVMTAYLVFDRLKAGELTTDTEFTTSERAWREGGFASGSSVMGLRPNEKARIEDLLRGMIVVSGNDACIVLAEGISGSEAAFAAEMNATAQKLGLTTAQFDNASGLYTETQRISAEDLARLSNALIRDFPEYYQIYSEREYTWNNVRQPNRNRLLGTFLGADGIKTGHLSQSGYGMVASAVQDGRRIIVVVNGLPSEAERAKEAERLLRLGFSAFETRTIGTPDAVIAELPVILGQSARVGVALKEAITLTAGKRALRDGKTEIVFKGPLRAPLKAGDVVAELEIRIDGRAPIRAPLYAVADVPRRGFLGRALDGLGAVLFGGSSD